MICEVRHAVIDVTNRCTYIHIPTPRHVSYVYMYEYYVGTYCTVHILYTVCAPPQTLSETLDQVAASLINGAFY